MVVEDFGSDASPARKAGLEPGDIIVSVDGKPVEYVGQLQQQIAFRQPGDVVKVEVARKGGAHKTLDVRLQELPRRQDRGVGRRQHASNGDATDDSAARIGKLGITVAPVDERTCSSCSSSPTSAAPW